MAANSVSNDGYITIIIIIIIIIIIMVYTPQISQNFDVQSHK